MLIEILNQSIKEHEQLITGKAINCKRSVAVNVKKNSLVVL